MKNRFKCIGGGIVYIALFVMLFTACPNPTTNNNDPYKDSYIPSVDNVGATYADVLICKTPEELQTLSKYSISLYKEDNTNPEYSISYYSSDLSFKKTIYADAYAKDALIPNTNYTLEIEYITKDHDEVERFLTFKTKAYDFSSYELKYEDEEDTIYIYTNELKVGNLDVYRSESIDGEYSEISTISNKDNSFFMYYYDSDSETLETNKTYYYKFEIYDSTSSKNLLYKSTTPLSVTTGVIPPKSVDMASLKYIQGITRVQLTWDEVKDADEYDIVVTNNSSTVLDTKTVTEAAYEFDAIQCEENFTFGSRYKEYKINITAKNAGGTSSTENGRFTLSVPGIRNVEVIPGQKEAQYICSTTFDYIPEGFTVEYVLKERSKSEDIIDSSKEKILTRKNLLIDTTYSSFSEATNLAGYVYANITYKDKNGEDKNYTDSMKVDGFTTKGFDTVTNLEVTNVKSTSVTYKFTPLTTEQLNSQNAHYYVIADDGESPIIKEIDNPSAETHTIEGLSAGKNYSLKILVSMLSKSGLESYLDEYTNFAEIKVATDSGLSKPTNVVLSEETGSLPTQPYLNVTWDKIPEDDGSETVAYEIEFKVLRKSSFRKFLHNVGEDYVNTYINEYSAKMPVNAGNRYIVRVVTYKVDEPTYKVYSDEKEIQFSKFDDRSLATALLYPADVGNHTAGDVIDFADPNVWNNLMAPKSSLTKGYNFGITQFMGEAGTGLNFIIPEGDPEFFAFKFSFDGEDADNAIGIDSSYAPRLIFVDRNAFGAYTTLGKSYGEFSEIYIVEPNTEGYILKTFEAVGSNYLYKNVNMPYFSQQLDGSLATSTYASSAGIEIEENWIYNNSVYVGVKQELAGNLGFSYFY